MFFYNGLQSSDKRIERLAGILFLGPEGIAYLRLRQFVRGRLPQHLHQLLLHGGKFYDTAFRIDEPPILQRQAAIET